MYYDDDEIKRQLDEINDYINLKRAEQREYDKENEAKDKLNSIDKSIFRKTSIIAGAAAAGFNPNDPTSINKAGRNAAHAFGIIVTALLMIGALIAYMLFMPNNEKTIQAFTYAFLIFEAFGLFLIIRLIRSLLGKPLLIKMLFSRSDIRDARYYHSQNRSISNVVLIVLCALVLIIIFAIAVLILL